MDSTSSLIGKVSSTQDSADSATAPTTTTTTTTDKESSGNQSSNAAAYVAALTAALQRRKADLELGINADIKVRDLVDMLTRFKVKIKLSRASRLRQAFSYNKHIMIT